MKSSRQFSTSRRRRDERSSEEGTSSPHGNRTIFRRVETAASTETAPGDRLGHSVFCSVDSRRRVLDGTLGDGNSSASISGFFEEESSRVVFVERCPRAVHHECERPLFVLERACAPHPVHPVWHPGPGLYRAWLKRRPVCRACALAGSRRGLVVVSSWSRRSFGPSFAGCCRTLPSLPCLTLLHRLNGWFRHSAASVLGGEDRHGPNL